MALAGGRTAPAELREIERDLVDYRARAFGPDARQITLHVVNISSHGLMARCDAVYRVGQRVRVSLPVVGVVVAEIRWSLGGRIGFSFDSRSTALPYYELLAALLPRQSITP